MMMRMSNRSGAARFERSNSMSSLLLSSLRLQISRNPLAKIQIPYHARKVPFRLDPDVISFLGC
jgi:hypothetical protein